MDQILSKQNNLGALFLGNKNAAKNVKVLKENGISAVLTIADLKYLEYPNELNIKHLKIVIVDDMETTNLAESFCKCFEFIETQRQSTNVLVHCEAGISRSSTIVIAYLMNSFLWKFEQSLDFLRTKREIGYFIVFPNSGFQVQLRKFENKLFNSEKELLKAI